MKTAINIDYLIINFFIDHKKIDSLLENSKFGYSEKPFGTNIFKRAIDLYDHETKKLFAKLFFLPASGVIDENLAQLQIENRFLYEALQYQKGTINELILSLEMKFHSINRMDIAIDTQVYESNFLHENYMEFPDKIYSGAWLNDGRKCQISAFIEPVNGKYIKTGYTYGKRGQDRYFRLYDKSFYLFKQPKPWIEKFWEYYGIKKSSKVIRAEFELRQKFLKSIKDLDLIFSRKYLLSVFQIASAGFISPRKNQFKSRVSDNEKIDFFDFSELDLSGSGFEKESTKEPEIINENINYLKSQIRIFFRMYYESKQENMLPLFHIAKILEKEEKKEIPLYYDGSLKEYFYSKLEHWKDKYSKIYGFDESFYCNYKFSFDFFEVKAMDI